VGGSLGAKTEGREALLHGRRGEANFPRGVKGDVKELGANAGRKQHLEAGQRSKKQKAIKREMRLAMGLWGMEFVNQCS